MCKSVYVSELAMGVVRDQSGRMVVRLTLDRKHAESVVSTLAGKTCGKLMEKTDSIRRLVGEVLIAESVDICYPAVKEEAHHAG
jgi:hypothetical protein